MAGVEGFEPSQAVLETDVLPLTLYPFEITLLLYTIKRIYASKIRKKDKKILVLKSQKTAYIFLRSLFLGGNKGL